MLMNLDTSTINAAFSERNSDHTFVNLSVPELVEHIIAKKEGVLSNSGAVMVRTGEFTGRSPGDKYIVDYGQVYDSEIDWGKVNQHIKPENFDHLLNKVLIYLQDKDVFIQDVVAGADESHQRSIRIISNYAWSTLFSKNLFLQADLTKPYKADFLLIQAPGFKAEPMVDGVKTPTFVIIDFTKHIILIGNTQYAGEIKKSVFTVMNRVLPSENVLPMHCSANIGQNGETALFFGLSGTGKTTLSSDPDRALIGDDEHGWSEAGIFNFEGGCYAKTINLQHKYEPLIWNAVHSFASVLENVVYDSSTRICDFTDDSITENTRGAYDLSRIENYVRSGKGGHPKNIFFLSADAFGVLPPISLLDNEQVLQYFLAGYTSKLAGTERGLGNEPVATFSSCFGAPFLPLSPIYYAKMLQERIGKHNSNVWLINTGWIGGSYGIGERINLPFTRSMITAALNNQINIDNVRIDTTFGLRVPIAVDGVPGEILDQKLMWKDQLAYQKTAEKLIKQIENCLAQYKYNSLLQKVRNY
jgi:phosphoenolpyruvate carboxykinase (ATP)